MPIEYSKQNGIATLLVNRPHVRNALDWRAQQQFADAVHLTAEDDTLRALIVVGAGDTFVSGGDLKDQQENFEVETGRRLTSVMGRALQELTQLPIPVIAAINGNAYGGGCEIITACDLRIMASNASLHFVQARMGLTTGWGGGPRLVALIGAGRALELLLTTRAVSAGEAQELGLVQRVVDSDVTAAAYELASELARLPRQALSAVKKLVYQSAGLSLSEGYEIEKRLFLEQWVHPDHVEAVTAFLARRPPRFNR